MQPSRAPLPSTIVTETHSVPQSTPTPNLDRILSPSLLDQVLDAPSLRWSREEEVEAYAMHEYIMEWVCSCDKPLSRRCGWYMVLDKYPSFERY